MVLQRGLPSKLANKSDDEYRKRYQGHPLTPGEKGVYASHYLLWEKCIELDEPIAIFEDDFLPTPFFKQIILKLPELHKSYHYLRLEPQDTNFKNQMITNTTDGFQVVMWMDNAGGARGYSITPYAAKQFIKGSEQWLRPVDNFIGEPYKHKIPSLGLIPYSMYNPQDMETQIQFSGKKKLPLYRKPFREISRLYRDFKLLIWNKIICHRYL